LAIILGSGLGAVADAISEPVALPYAALPGFPVSAVAGHGNRLVLGRLGGLPVACLQGRTHVYEGAGFAAMAVPIRALRRAGITTLLLTNAAGSLRPEVAPGRLMLIEDHINLLPGNPLTGANDPAIGPRFPALRDAYDPALRNRMKTVAQRLAIDLATGIYLACAGPSFETPAEIRAFRLLGADAVGMSTVNEVILARHCGLDVAAISAISNLAEGVGPDGFSHDQALAVAERAAGDLTRLITGFCADLTREGIHHGDTEDTE
ncbi:MAG TPA: purine-nucleoside phosphorylase, partial [Stellaceae bacterium]|nr:purine-nucleoside phosphorylase [Stellaceae bacterium]